MMNILVVVEDNRGSMHRMSKEAIAGAQKIGGNITALVIGANADAIADQLSVIALENTLVVKHELVSSYNSDGYTEVVKQVIQSINPSIIIIGHTYQTRDFMPRVSARLDIPFIPDIIGLEQDAYTKQVLNSKLNSSVSSLSENIELSVGLL